MTEVRLPITTTAGEEVFFTFDTDDIDTWTVSTVYGSVEVPHPEGKPAVWRELTGDVSVTLRMEFKNRKRPLWKKKE